MDAIYADYSISMSDFKKNPAQVLRTAGEKPVAVLNHNRPAFYMVTPKLFEALVQEVGDRDLVAGAPASGQHRARDRGGCGCPLTRRPAPRATACSFGPRPGLNGMHWMAA